MPTSRSLWETRVERARELAPGHSETREALTFYASLAAVQQQLLEQHAGVVRTGRSVEQRLDFSAAADALLPFLSALAAFAPAPLASAVRALQTADGAARHQLLRDYWTTRIDPDPPRGFIAEALLQPFAEVARLSLAAASREDALSASEQDSLSGHANVCPQCAGRPLIALFSERGHGAMRSLVCGLCLQEWRADRLGCVGCGEQASDRLSVYRAEEFASARIDACDTCRTYIKSLDLTAEAGALAVVDDIALLPLDLWARSEGYVSVRPTLLRL